MNTFILFLFLILLSLLLFIINTLLDIQNFFILIKKNKRLHIDNELDKKYQFIKGLF